MKSIVGTKLGAPSKGVIVSDGYAEGKTALGGRLRLTATESGKTERLARVYATARHVWD